MRTRLKPEVSCDTGKSNYLRNTHVGLIAYFDAAKFQTM